MIRELAELQERHTKLREDYCDPTESPRKKVHDNSFRREVQWREKEEELAVAQAEISCLRGQLACVATIWDRAFAYGRAASIARLRARLPPK